MHFNPDKHQKGTADMQILILVLVAVNIIAFILTGTDKWLAKTKRRRLPERVMIQMTALGGGIGVLSAFYTFRHKTKHFRLLFIIWSITAAEIFLAILLFSRIIKIQ